MAEMYAISRVASYKFSGCGGVLKEALRTLPNYDNPDCDPSRSHLNVALVECPLNGLTPERYILKYREDNDIRGRFNTSATNPKNLTNCMFQSLFTASPEYLADMSREEQIEYFEMCLEFFRREFPSAHIVAANIHFDETTPHLHVTALPTIERVNKKTGELETIFSTTLLMPGKDFFRQYQDRFFEYITSRYDGLSRGNSDRKNMSVREFKEYCRLEEKYMAACRQLEAYRVSLSNHKKHIEVLSAELERVNSAKRWFESIPLLGEFFSVLRRMKVESIEFVLNEALAIAREEERLVEREEKTVDSLLLDAKKRSIIGSLFGKEEKTSEKCQNTIDTL